MNVKDLGHTKKAKETGIICWAIEFGAQWEIRGQE